MLRPLILVLLLTLTGCGSSTETREYKITPVSPTETARSVLKNYANGGGVGSEFRELESLVNDLKESDSESAKAFETFFTNAQKQPDRVGEFARQALSKISK